MIKDIDTLISQKTEIPVYIADKPLDCVANILSHAVFRPSGIRPQCYFKVLVCNTAPYPQSCLITHRRAADSDIRPPVPIYS